MRARLRALGREPERVTALTERALEAYAGAGALCAHEIAAVRAWQAVGP